MAVPVLVAAGAGLAARFAAKSAGRAAVTAVRNRAGGQIVKQASKKGGNQLADKAIRDLSPRPNSNRLPDIPNVNPANGSLIEVVGSNGSNITNAINNLSRSMLASGGFDIPDDFFVNQAVKTNQIDNVANSQINSNQNLAEFLGSLIGTLEMQVRTMDRLIDKIDGLTKVGDTITVSPTPVTIENRVNPTPINVTNQVSSTPINVNNNVNPTPVTVKNSFNASLQIDKPLDINLPSDYAKSVIDTNTKQNELMDNQIEDLTYKKTAKDLKDLNGNDIATASPRDMEFIKNGAKAQVDSDENSFGRDDELDDFDFDTLDLSKFFEIFTLSLPGKIDEEYFGNK